jgi:hypothetical protein
MTRREPTLALKPKSLGFELLCGTMDEPVAKVVQTELLAATSALRSSKSLGLNTLRLTGRTGRCPQLARIIRGSAAGRGRRSRFQSHSASHEICVLCFQPLAAQRDFTLELAQVISPICAVACSESSFLAPQKSDTPVISASLAESWSWKTASSTSLAGDCGRR